MVVACNHTLKVISDSNLKDAYSPVQDDQAVYDNGPICHSSQVSIGNKPPQSGNGFLQVPAKCILSEHIILPSCRVNATWPHFTLHCLGHPLDDIECDVNIDHSGCWHKCVIPPCPVMCLSYDWSKVHPQLVSLSLHLCCMWV